MIKKKIYENGKLQFELRFSGRERDREVVTLVRAGDSWTPPYQGKPACKVVSDGNGLDVTIYRLIGEEPTKLQLDFAEASDLGILLQEYTKSDPYAPKPLYEIKGTKELREEKEKALRDLAEKMMNVNMTVSVGGGLANVSTTLFEEPKPERYCITCGAGCVKTTGYGLFNEKTGVQSTWPIYACPNKRWYQFWHPVQDTSNLADYY